METYVSELSCAYTSDRYNDIWAMFAVVVLPFHEIIYLSTYSVFILGMLASQGNIQEFDVFCMGLTLAKIITCIFITFQNQR